MLDPEVARFVDALLQGYARYPELATAALPRRREIAGLVRAPWTQGGPAMAERRDLRFATSEGEVGLRLLVPPGAPEDGPVLVYLHGGGFVTFSLDTHDRLMREVAARSGVAVLGVDYALSPEVRWPVALHQVRDVVTALAAGVLPGVRAGRIALGGDSAGANLALSTALALRDAGRGDLVAALLLNYGFFGSGFDTPSHARFGGAEALLTTEELGDYLDAYLAGTEGWSSPLALPALAELHQLPPSFHLIAECDPLADADRDMAERMRAAGNGVEAVVYPGACHGFIEAVAISRLADRALGDASAWLRDRLG